MHADRKHVYIGRHPGRPNGLGPLQVGLRGVHRLFRGFQALGSQNRSVVSSRHRGDDFHLYTPHLFPGQFPRQLGGLYRVACLASVIEHLVHRELGLEIVESVGPVQRADIEIVRTELVLSE